MRKEKKVEGMGKNDLRIMQMYKSATYSYTNKLYYPGYVFL